MNERTADGCTYETVLELESERVIYQSMVYAGNDIAYVNSEGDLVGYQGTNGAGSSVQKIYSGESITWDSSPVSESQTFTGLSYEDVSVGFGTINYCWYPTYDGFAYIFEDGAMVSGFSVTYSADSKFKIERDNGEIVYIMDDVVYRRTMDLYPDSSMVADITIYGIPGVDVTVRNLMINRMTEVQYADCGEVSGISRKYRYGFQNQEKDDEIKGSGNSVNYTYRMHDPRIGRFFAVDPLAPEYPHNSPYAFSENVVINATELEGKELDFAFRIIDMIYGEEKLKQTTAGTILNRVGEWYTGEVLIQSAEADFYKFQHSPKDYYMDKLYDELTMGAYSTSKGMTDLAQRAIEGDVEASVDVAMNILIMIGMRKAIKLPEVVVEAPRPVVKNPIKPYTPKRKIENNPKTGKPKVDADATGKAHTQLGEKQSKSGAGTYSKRRTVDKDGNTRKEIDYTDHNRPKDHPNPHKHDWKKNNKGQYERGKATEL